MNQEFLNSETLHTYVLGNLDNDFETIKETREMTVNEARAENKKLVSGNDNHRWIKAAYLDQ